MAIAGLVLGIVALATGWLSWFSLITLPVAIVALVLSAVGGKKAKAAGKKSGVATAGVVIGIISGRLIVHIIEAAILIYHCHVTIKGLLHFDGHNTPFTDKLAQHCFVCHTVKIFIPE